MKYGNLIVEKNMSEEKISNVNSIYEIDELNELNFCANVLKGFQLRGLNESDPIEKETQYMRWKCFLPYYQRSWKKCFEKGLIDENGKIIM